MRGQREAGLDHSDRRYTDQEVALVLQRAAEIEERRAAGPGRGLTLLELREIAREVGLSPDAIDAAVATIEAGTGPRGASLLGPPLSARLVRAVPGRLDEEALQGLVRVIEDTEDATGTVTEALGTVRWTSVGRGHKFDRTTQVSLSSNAQETQIQVVQRYPAGLRIILQALPGAWGAMFGAGIALGSRIGPLAVIGVGLGALALGVSLGRWAWFTIARRSERRVQDLAARLVEAAGKSAERSQ